MRARIMQKAAPQTYGPDGWQEDAACSRASEVDAQAFTGGHPTKAIAEDINARYCTRCPVVNDCLKWAHEEFAFSGIAGGCAFIGEKAAGNERRIYRIGVNK